MVGVGEGGWRGCKNYFLFAGLTALATCACTDVTRLQLEHSAEEILRGCGQKVDFGVRMQAVQVGRLRRYVLVNVGVVALVVAARRYREAGRQVELAVEHVRVHVLLEVGATQATVPVVGDVPAVHDLAEQIAQILPRHFCVALQVVVQHVRTYGQIARVERIIPFI